MLYRRWPISHLLVDGLCESPNKVNLTLTLAPQRSCHNPSRFPESICAHVTHMGDHQGRSNILFVLKVPDFIDLLVARNS